VALPTQIMLVKLLNKICYVCRNLPLFKREVLLLTEYHDTPRVLHRSMRHSWTDWTVLSSPYIVYTASIHVYNSSITLSVFYKYNLVNQHEW